MPETQPKQRHFLGSLCLRGHDHENTGQSLRYYKPTGPCVTCTKMQAKQHQKNNPEQARASSLIRSRRKNERLKQERAANRVEKPAKIWLDDKFLGALCRRGHDYEGTGRSLRFKCGVCTQCAVLSTQRARARNPEKARARGRVSDKRRYSRGPRRLWQQNYVRQRYATDEQYRIAQIVRGRVRGLLRQLEAAPEKRNLSNRSTHQAALILAVLGPRPHPNWHLCHKEPVCSFDATAPDFLEKCWNPSNLFWGPPEDNYATLGEDRSKSIRRKAGTQLDGVLQAGSVV